MPTFFGCRHSSDTAARLKLPLSERDVSQAFFVGRNGLGDVERAWPERVKRALTGGISCPDCVWTTILPLPGYGTRNAQALTGKIASGVKRCGK
jgi:hypothetical protein